MVARGSRAAHFNVLHREATTTTAIKQDDRSPSFALSLERATEVRRGLPADASHGKQMEDR